MPDEQPNSGTEPTLEDESSARDMESKEEEVDSSQYEAIVREYGDAMLQMRKLHARVDGLAQQLQEGVAESDDSEASPDRDGRPDMDGVLARIEDVERWLQNASISHDSKGSDGRHETNNLSEIQARIGMLESRLEETPPDGRGT
ncbi:MAG: hypothetical protein IIA53_02025, partial [Chloroflexi bacterium]|nr:hypothetical protein [Chloroflexota bacterium]